MNSNYDLNEVSKVACAPSTPAQTKGSLYDLNHVARLTAQHQLGRFGVMPAVNVYDAGQPK